MFPIQSFTPWRAKFLPFVFFACNQHKFKAFLTIELTQYLFSWLWLRYLFMFIVIDFFMMYFSAADTAIFMIMTAHFKRGMAYRTDFIHSVVSGATRFLSIKSLRASCIVIMPGVAFIIFIS